MEGREAWIGNAQHLNMCALGQDFALFVSPAVGDKRTMGAALIYVSEDGKFELCSGDGRRQLTDIALILPYTNHRISGNGRRVITFLIEPEFINLRSLPLWRAANSDLVMRRLSRRIRNIAETIERGNGEVFAALDSALELGVFGRELERSYVDPRVRAIINCIRAEPAARNAVVDLAAQQGISGSRLSHLFKSEIGISFRLFRAWKRARSVPQRVLALPNLTEVALESGYPDSTHFCHAIRRTYGLQPRVLRAAVMLSNFHLRSKALSSGPNSGPNNGILCAMRP